MHVLDMFHIFYRVVFYTHFFFSCIVPNFHKNNFLPITIERNVGECDNKGVLKIKYSLVKYI